MTRFGRAVSAGRIIRVRLPGIRRRFKIGAARRETNHSPFESIASPPIHAARKCSDGQESSNARDHAGFLKASPFHHRQRSPGGCKLRHDPIARSAGWLRDLKGRERRGRALARRPGSSHDPLPGAPNRDGGLNRSPRKAEAGYHKARLDRELAEITLLEYQEGVLAQDLATVEGEVALAESDLRRAEDRLQWAKRMFAKGFVSLAQRVSEELATKRALFSLEQAQTKKQVLVKFTKEKTVKELKGEVAKARSEELARKSTWELKRAAKASSNAALCKQTARTASPTRLDRAFEYEFTAGTQ